MKTYGRDNVSSVSSSNLSVSEQVEELKRELEDSISCTRKFSFEDRGDVKEFEKMFTPAVLDLADRVMYGDKTFNKYSDEALLKYLAEEVFYCWNRMHKTIDLCDSVAQGTIECSSAVALIMGMTPEEIKRGFVEKVKMNYAIVAKTPGYADDEQVIEADFTLTPHITGRENDRNNFASLGVRMNANEGRRRLRLRKVPDKPVVVDYYFDILENAEAAEASEQKKESGSKIVWGFGQSE
jgi:hypothetical protein